ncbi:ankyrin repeat protein [Metarhizium robertsii]|uniref:Ankyrin repeat protein n=3 Tax=Metarhizium TaxID=5529 RepID=E9FA24_METRA|nr:Ankyrin repeat protein [Metarhizium robertsii ARSEF 23]EFY95422.1 Ankyrin repeat protein [Metarhizium robertsii ARSEF 23]EXU95055.1 ankyrin repeat protein [Metarhizium robertsii]
MDKELEHRHLENADILELFCLQGNLEPTLGCDGPSLAAMHDSSPPNPPKMLDLLTDRWSHVVGAYVRLEDETQHLLVNNAYMYLKEDPASRWPQLLARSSRNSSPSWSCCAKSDKTHTTQREPASTSTYHDPAEGTDNGLSTLNCSKEEVAATAPPIRDIPPKSRTHGNQISGRGSLTCPHCNLRAIRTIRSLVTHGRNCSQTPSSARAKTVVIPHRTCIYECGYSRNNYARHENLQHYRCSCGKITTKSHKDCLPIRSTPIDPVKYFVYPPIETPKPTPDDILDTVFSGLPPFLARLLEPLDDHSLASTVRRALQKCQGLVAPKYNGTDPPEIIITDNAGEARHQHVSKLMSNTLPQFQLATENVVPDTAEVVEFAMNGNIDGLKDLFSRKLASPRDWALYGGMHQFETVQFLINHGAYVDKDSYEHVYDFTFRGKCSNMELLGLACVRLSQGNDWIEEQKFPLIHTIILGISNRRLEAELKANPSAVHLRDAQGRTALDWATARSQLDDMKLLINHGSDPNSMDIQGRTTILHAVDSHSDEAVRIILEAGADPNPTMPNGKLRSSPLASASFGGLAETITLLLKHEAKVNACNPEGRTALHWVALTDNVECATILLESKADLDSPLMTAITHNSHAVLELFVGRCTTSYPMREPQFLDQIAKHADVKTMSVLASSLPLKMSLNLSENSFAACQENLRLREDYNQELDFAFEQLVFPIVRVAVS